MATLGPLFLTFDDGPDPDCTPQVLELLKAKGAKATFFVVAERAQTHPELIQQMRSQGHSLGNHSLDHSYWPFFGSELHLRQWIRAAELALSTLSGETTVGFRPPAGVVTPPLKRALTHLQMPLILWHTRFYDALWSWSERSAQASLQKAEAGDIILLHDRQRRRNRSRFLQTLEFYLEQAHRRGFEFVSLKGPLQSLEPKLKVHVTHAEV